MMSEKKKRKKIKTKKMIMGQQTFIIIVTVAEFL